MRVAVGVRNVPRSAEVLAVLLHQRLEHLLPSREAHIEEGGLRVGQHREQRQRNLDGGDG